MLRTQLETRTNEVIYWNFPVHSRLLKYLNVKIRRKITAWNTIIINYYTRYEKRTRSITIIRQLLFRVRNLIFGERTALDSFRGLTLIPAMQIVQKVISLLFPMTGRI